MLSFLVFDEKWLKNVSSIFTGGGVQMREMKGSFSGYNLMLFLGHTVLFWGYLIAVVCPCIFNLESANLCFYNILLGEQIINRKYVFSRSTVQFFFSGMQFFLEI